VRKKGKETNKKIRKLLTYCRLRPQTNDSSSLYHGLGFDGVLT